VIAPVSRLLLVLLFSFAALYSVKAMAQSADLEIVSLVPSQTSMLTDETFRYTVRVRNLGPDAASQVSVAAGANAMALFRGITAPKGWTCDASRPWFGYALNCSTPTLAPGAEAEFVVTLGAAQHSAMTYRINALIATTTRDPVELNNAANVPLTLRTGEVEAELALTATGARFEVRNNGPHAATQVTIVATGAVMTASGPGWKCTSHETSVACTRASLGAGKTAAIVVRPKKPAVIEARVRAEKIYDQIGRNNAASVTLPAPAKP
jgi:large repetitive protein